ncbi:ATP-binding sensor histidine kinase [Kamptonema sp. UHCC 0994]|uniref:trifunctional serine/threonine-protein kinase/ATP-binding protein/sensor histidine kinase n=1 Tax=Kamptonema sp. UHCC 0994 TaxID=3031329 RepID=UPI0023B95F28|nr:ATP-binding sensor histidine kinase [Kamptonema sp. UHCC 0994]MDF0554169.1 AAA family ATPase [Kamptonema sp. UHCC 0994]
MRTPLPGYQLNAPLHEGTKTVIYQGRYELEHTPVIIKTLKAEYPTLEEIARIRHEYQILHSLNIPGIIKPIELKPYEHGLALILEDFGGQPLKQYINDQKTNLINFLQIASQLAQILGELHQNQIIHKDIKPQNILIKPETRQIKLIDFSIATRLEKENPTISNPNYIEGTLAYMSPEQTGRMNRSIDYRTDFYSLGVTFYEMLAGQLPFNSNDPMELVHCHIAKQPKSLNQLNPEIPKAVVDIIMKLLAKTAEDRYQSARGLLADLEECLKQLEASGQIKDFTAGKLDRFGQFLIPQKLYGRETEVAILMAAFERVAVGSTEMMLVSGYSGIGKTCVVQEIHKPIVRQRGYFIAGKFDQFKKNIPYAALIQAFQELIRQLLTENSENIGIWKEKLVEALGQNGRVIIDVIPEVELIMGEQPEVPQLGPTESQNRFNRVYKQFIHVFTKPEHPLVLFLDDLQWADSASLKLLQLLITDTDSEYLLLIGAYRDNEVSPTHPTIQTIEEIEKAGAVVNNIVLQALDISNVRQLVADTLQGDKSRELADLLFNKTQGNPFFLTQLFKTLHSELLLNFDFIKSCWQWDIKQIQSLGIADYNVVQLVARNIQKLPETTQKILQLAACIGNRFNLDVCAIVNEKPPLETADDLWSALQAGLILPLSNDYKIPLAFQSEEQGTLLFDESRVGYKFLHDRVQQAAYSMIPENQKKVTHLKIGKLLLHQYAENALEENIFDIVNQLNIGVEFIAQQSERDELANFNLIAGRKAKAATAYEAAVRYLNVGLELLPESSWHKHYELMRYLHLETLEAEYLNTNFERAQHLSEIVLLQAKNQLEKVKVYELRIPFYLQQNQPQAALETALQVLKMLGISLPRNPTKFSIMMGLIRNKIAIGGKQIENLALLPLMTDPYKLAAMRILIAIIPAAFMANPMLFPLIVFKMVNLSLQYGNSPLSAYGYVSYGMLLCGVLSDIDSGYQFGKLAIRLVEEFATKEIKAKIDFLFNCFIKQWKEHLKETAQPLLEAFKTGLETGDIEYSCYSVCNYSHHCYWSGDHLESTVEKYIKYTNLMLEYKQYLVSDQTKLGRQFVLNMLDQSADKFTFIGDGFNESEMIVTWTKTNNYTFIAYLYLFKSVLFYLFKKITNAVEVAGLTEKYKESLGALIHSSEHNFYYSLILLAHYPATTKTEQKQYLKKVASHQKQMKNWAHHAPMNFQHKYELVEAEKARVLGQNETAITYYERAINGAKENGYIQEEALANERAAEFYLALGREKVAKTYMTEAYYCYIRWGAIAKVRDLEETYPHLISRTQQPETISLDPTSTTTSNRTTTSTSGHSTALDLGTMMKAAQALSGEIVLSELLNKLMTIVIENAGATGGSLLTKPTFSSNQSENQWVISATGIVEGNDLTVLTNSQQPEEENTSVSLLGNAVPVAIINYVARTKETVVLNDASHEGIFKKDPYIQQNQPKSILCTPLLNQGQLSGIIYLENNLTTVAFTADRLTVLQMLSGQAAIAITNAQLYAEVNQLNQNLEQANQQLAAYSETLEQKVEERTAELKTAQKQIVASEKLASLGALTAGVAHEIRNPLNFVTSLATLSGDLTSEIAEQIDRQSQNLDSESLELINENLTYLKRNVSEINEQGQRANSIIQSMLLHARSEGSSRQKTDINALVAQALQLAYHSIRAKDKTFNLTIETDYDKSIEELDVAFSDLSRALINIIDNACYASHIKQFKVTGDFNPTVSIATKNLGTAIEIRIHDNGIGIPKENQQKIFLPFFTTKPPGQGTGLGLSITHDIIVGQHRGNLEVQTETGNYTEFIITLPKS